MPVATRTSSRDEGASEAILGVEGLPRFLVRALLLVDAQLAVVLVEGEDVLAGEAL